VSAPVAEPGGAVGKAEAPGAAQPTAGS
jgi:hypothetical protein